MPITIGSYHSLCPVAIGQSVGLSVCRLVGLSVGRSVGWSVCRSAGLSVGRSVGLSVCRSAGRSVGRPVSGSVSRLVAVLVSDQQTEVHPHLFHSSPVSVQPVQILYDFTPRFVVVFLWSSWPQRTFSPYVPISIRLSCATFLYNTGLWMDIQANVTKT